MVGIPAELRTPVDVLTASMGVPTITSDTQCLAPRRTTVACGYSSKYAGGVLQLEIYYNVLQGHSTSASAAAAWLELRPEGH